MTINHIEVIRSYDKGLLRAVFSATIDNCLAIVGIKVIQGRTKRFVLLPCRKNKLGLYEEILRFSNYEDKLLFEETILKAYDKYLEIKDAFEE